MVPAKRHVSTLYQRMLDAFAAEWEVLSPGTISRQIGQYLLELKGSPSSPSKAVLLNK